MTDTPFCARAAEPLPLEEQVKRLQVALAVEERRNDELADRLDKALSASPAAAMREALEAIQRMARTGKNAGDLGDWRGLFAAITEKTDGLLRALPLPAPEPVGAEAGEAAEARFDEIADRFPEINTLNYDEDDVAALNGWGVEAAFALEDAAREVRRLGALAERASSAEAEIERLREKLRDAETERDTALTDTHVKVNYRIIENAEEFRAKHTKESA